MNKIKRILVPLAYSPYSQGIVDYAVMLGRSLAAERMIFASVINKRDVEAVSTIASYGYHVDEQEYVETIEQQRREQLEEMLAGHDLPTEQVKLVFKVGKPSTELLRLAIAEEVDMIVMGLKAQNELMHAFTGSVAERLFHRSPVTIVSYRDETIADPLRKRIMRHWKKR